MGKKFSSAVDDELHDNIFIPNSAWSHDHLRILWHPSFIQFCVSFSPSPKKIFKMGLELWMDGQKIITISFLLGKQNVHLLWLRCQSTSFLLSTCSPPSLVVLDYGTWRLFHDQIRQIFKQNIDVVYQLSKKQNEWHTLLSKYLEMIFILGVPQRPPARLLVRTKVIRETY